MWKQHCRKAVARYAFYWAEMDWMPSVCYAQYENQIIAKRLKAPKSQVCQFFVSGMAITHEELSRGDAGELVKIQYEIALKSLEDIISKGFWCVEKARSRRIRHYLSARKAKYGRI